MTNPQLDRSTPSSWSQTPPSGLLGTKTTLGSPNLWGTVTATNSTFVANTASSGGGVFWAEGGTVRNATFKSNAGGNAGAISGGQGPSSPSWAIDDTIFGSATDGCAWLGAAPVGSGNLTAATSGCPGTETTAPALALADLADNGGPTQTVALGAGSVAIDALAPVAGACGTAVDQRGDARPQGPGCDAGTSLPSDPSTALRIDTIAPTTTATVASLALNATLGKTTIPVPVSLAWSGVDAGSGIDHFEVALSTNGKAYALVASPTAASYARSFRSSSKTTYRFRVRAFDRSGNVSAWMYGSTFRVRLVQETASTVLRYSGTWSTGSSSSASGGHFRYATRTGASVSYTFTGRSLAVVAYKASNLGKVKVYLDGHYLTTVNLGTATAWRQVVYSKTWASSAKHTVKLVWAGTSGHTRIDLDAFVVLK